MLSHNAQTNVVWRSAWHLLTEKKNLSKDCTNYFQIRNVLNTQKVPVLLYLSLSLLVTHGKIQTVSLKDAVAWLGLFQMQLPPEGVEVSMWCYPYVPTANLCHSPTPFWSHVQKEPYRKKKQLDNGPTLLTARGGRQCWPPGEKAGIQGQGWDLNPFWQHYGFSLGLFSF